MSENKRYSFKYYNDVYMIRIIDNYKEESNGWGVCNVKETVQRLNELNDENKALKAENKRYKCINKQLEDRLGRSLALDMEECE